MNSQITRFARSLPLALLLAHASVACSRDDVAPSRHGAAAAEPASLVLTEPNDSRPFSAALGRAGLLLKSGAPHDGATLGGDEWQLALSSRRLGCRGSQLLALDSVHPTRVAAQRVSFGHALAERRVDEWYEAREGAIEQGFTIAESPCSGSGTLTIELDVQGLTARPGADGDIELLDERGQVRLRYSHLFAKDALGRALPATMQALGTRIALDVELSGAVFPVLVDPLIWAPQPKLSVADGEGDDRFGGAVAVSGDTAAVGIPFDNVGANSDQGSVQVFVRSAGLWGPQQRITAADGTSSENFGQSVALSGDTLVVGEPLDDGSGGGNPAEGDAFVFVRSGSTWSQQQLLRTPDAWSGARFGQAVAIEGNTLVIGAPSIPVNPTLDGAAYVFVRAGTVWSLQQTLSASDAAVGDLFGWNVAISGETMLVGAFADSPFFGPRLVSNAYVFVRSGTTWTEQQKLAASDDVTSGGFGHSVAVLGDTALVGAPFLKVGFNGAQGAGYVFTRSGTSWSQQQKLVDAGGVASDQLGMTLALGQDWALLGAPNFDINRGQVIPFSRQAGAWTEQAALTASDGQDDDEFGSSLAVSGSNAIVGARSDDFPSRANQGSAYPLLLRKSNGDACDNGSECHSKFCADGRCCNVACGAVCDACSVAAGATKDGECAIVAAGSPGEPVCAAPVGCDGLHGDCRACVGDTSCAADHYCDAAGACQPRKAQAASCDLAADCKVAGCRACSSGHCSDGFCCDSVCAGCSACSAALTGDADGICSPIPTGQDQHEFCVADAGYPGNCLADGTCDGMGKCRDFAPRGLPCGDAACEKGEVTGLLCSGDGACDAGSEPCAPYVCATDACATTCVDDSECVDDTYCVAGACVPQTERGESCDKDRQCATGYCSDGVCCNSGCDGQCEACNEPETTGTCAPVAGAPRADRPACSSGDGEDPCTEAVCDGEASDNCAGFVGAEVACRQASCSDGVAINEASCNGKGVCPSERSSMCGAYACAKSACATSCVSDGDCSDAFRCVASSQKCVARDTTSCSDDGLEQLNPDGTTLPCAPYVCSGIACLDACVSSDDCAERFVCNADDHVCERAVGNADDDGGCGCRSAGHKSRGEASALLGLLLVVLAQRRRRRSLAEPACTRACSAAASTKP